MLSRHHNDCNVWVNCQQCDGPDNSRTCTCRKQKALDKQIEDLKWMKRRFSNLTNQKEVPGLNK